MVFGYQMWYTRLYSHTRVSKEERKESDIKKRKKKSLILILLRKEKNKNFLGYHIVTQKSRAFVLQLCDFLGTPRGGQEYPRGEDMAIVATIVDTCQP